MISSRMTLRRRKGGNSTDPNGWKRQFTAQVSTSATGVLNNMADESITEGGRGGGGGERWCARPCYRFDSFCAKTLTIRGGAAMIPQ